MNAEAPTCLRAAVVHGGEKTLYHSRGEAIVANRAQAEGEVVEQIDKKEHRDDVDGENAPKERRDKANVLLASSPRDPVVDKLYEADDEAVGRIG